MFPISTKSEVSVLVYSEWWTNSLNLHSIDHKDFMKEYPAIFANVKKPASSLTHSRPYTINGIVTNIELHEVQKLESQLGQFN